MKYGIITFHRAINFGAVLQAYALRKIIQKSGRECDIIDYRSDFIENTYKEPRLIEQLNLKRIYNIIFRNGYLIFDKESFTKFLEEYLDVNGKNYFEKKQMKDLEKKYDKFIVGSDQVWNHNCTNFDKTYFLDFFDNSNKKTSYAASFGLEKISDEYVEEYKNLLNNFKSISVREKQGAEIVKKLIGKEVPVVLDPTLLLDVNEWKEIARGNIINEKYILVYLLAETKSIIKFAKKLGKQKGLKVIYINDRLFKKIGIKNLSKISPNYWITLFANAEYIVTNSFHGTAFAINFNKDFYTELLPKGAKVNSRLINILELVGLNERLINTKEKKDKNKYLNMNSINYELVNKKLQKAREKSIEYINSEILELF